MLKRKIIHKIIDRFINNIKQKEARKLLKQSQEKLRKVPDNTERVD